MIHSEAVLSVIGDAMLEHAVAACDFFFRGFKRQTAGAGSR